MKQELSNHNEMRQILQSIITVCKYILKYIKEKYDLNKYTVTVQVPSFP